MTHILRQFTLSLKAVKAGGRGQIGENVRSITQSSNVQLVVADIMLSQ